MSASEKLRALDEAATARPWDYRGTPRYDWSVERGDAETIATLRNSLPQIVAVVETAELFFPEHLAVLRSDLPRALAALDEALS